MALPFQTPMNIAQRGHTASQDPWQTMALQLAQSQTQQQAQAPQQLGLRERFQQDPNLQMALLSAGTQIMQPLQPGQTLGGHLGAGVAGGVNTFAQQQAAQAKGRREEREMQLKERKMTVEERQHQREMRIRAAEFRQRQKEYESNAPLRSAELEYKRAQVRALDRDKTGETERLASTLGEIFYASNPEQYGTPEGAFVAAIDYVLTSGKGSDPSKFASSFFGSIAPLMVFAPDMAEQAFDVYRELDKTFRESGLYGTSNLPQPRAQPPGEAQAQGASGRDPEELLALARQAVQEQRDPQEVLRVLQQNGINITLEELMGSNQEAAPRSFGFGRGPANFGPQP